MIQQIGKNLVQVSGKVSNVQHAVHTQGSIKTGVTGQVSGSVSSSNQYTFRIDKTPVTFKFKGGIDFADGDELVVVGKMKKGQVEGLAVKNLQTGASYDHYSGALVFFSWLLLLAGIPSMLLLIGFFLVPLAIIFILAMRKAKYAADWVANYQGDPVPA